MDRIECQWCKSQNDTGQTTCATCGAPLDARNLVSDSGWKEAPRLRDMTEFRFSGSTCQVEGELVPVAEINLGEGDWVFFEHHVLLWKDEGTPLSALPMAAGLKRMLGGMPIVISVAHGPGSGGLLPGRLRGGGRPAAAPEHGDRRTGARLPGRRRTRITYSFERIKGMTNMLHGEGMYLDRFVTSGEQGILLLHGYGNVFERTLATGEKILVEPGGFLYKDSSVQMNTVQLNVRTGFMRHGMYLAEMTGPGRVGIQSMYVHHHSG